MANCFKKLSAIIYIGSLSMLTISVQARDISLPKYSWHADLGAYHTNVLVGPNRTTIQSDPLTEILSISAVDVWGRIRSGFGIQPLDNPLVANHENYYSRRGEYFQRTTKRAERYLFHIVQECERRNMPTELALLPFIESSYNPHAHSPAKAEGLWQFIPSTGKQYSLSQNAFQDKRRDIIASTDAALTYLQRLYDMFGDWHLALASYNWGEGNVMKATRKAEAAGREISFNGISSYMPAETRNYVPKLLAVKNIVSRPDIFGIRLPEIQNRPYFVKIGKTKDIDLAVAAKLAEMPLDEFKALNPQYRYVIPGGDSVHILLPRDKAKHFQRNLLSWSRPLSSWTSYRVNEPRERIETIAEKLNVSPDIIRQANNIPSQKALKFGSTILVPRTTNFDQDIAPGTFDNAYIAYASDYTPSETPQNTNTESTTPNLAPSDALKEKLQSDRLSNQNLWTLSNSSKNNQQKLIDRPKKSDVFLTTRTTKKTNGQIERMAKQDRIEKTDKIWQLTQSQHTRQNRKSSLLKETRKESEKKDKNDRSTKNKNMTVRAHQLPTKNTIKRKNETLRSSTQEKNTKQSQKDSAIKKIIYAKDSRKENTSAKQQSTKSIKDSKKTGVLKNRKK